MIDNPRALVQSATPIIALIVLALVWHRELPLFVTIMVGLLLACTILVAVHHSEVVAHWVGEPLGSLVLAVAVTVIEVALILSLLVSGGPGTETLARDTVFAAFMITCNGIVGIALLAAALRERVAVFNAEGTGAELATVTTLAVLCLVLPAFTTTKEGPEFSGAQLAFAGVASLALYMLFVFTQTVRHRDYFLPVSAGPIPLVTEHAAPPPRRTAIISLAQLLIALVAVVGLAKAISPSIESGVRNAGLPHSAVGLIIAMIVLLPETLAAFRAAMRNRVQISLNLALGSAMASIGLTIPVVAIATIWVSGPLELGLGPTQIVLLALTVVVSVLTIIPGRATVLQAGVHLLLFLAFLFLAVHP